MTKKLKQKGYDSQEIDQCLNILQERKYLQDERYREIRIKQLLNKNYSPSYIRHRLEEEKISSSLEQIEETMNLMALSTDQQRRNLVQKKLTQLDPGIPRERDKILRYLCSKGHSIEESLTTLEQIRQSR